MSTKPSATAEWDTNSTNLIPTLSGHTTDGYIDDEIPTAAEENGWKQVVGDWTKWLDDGDVALNDVTVGGSLIMSGVTALGIDDGNNTDVPTATDTGVLLVSYNAAQTNGNIQGIDGGTSGQEMLVVNDPANSLAIYLVSGGTSGNQIAVDAPLRIPGGAAVRLRYSSPKWLVVGASPQCSYLATLAVPAAAAAAVNPMTMLLNITGWDVNSGDVNDWVLYPITLPVGASLRSWSMNIIKGSNGSHTMSAKLWEYDSSTHAQSQVGSTQSNNANAPGTTTLGETITKAFAAGKTYYVQVYGSTATASADFYGDLVVTHH